MPTAYRRLAEVRRSRRFTVVAGRPIADFAERERHNFLAHERDKPLHAERLLERYDWRAFFVDTRDAAITILLLALVLGVLDELLGIAQ